MHASQPRTREGSGSQRSEEFARMSAPPSPPGEMPPPGFSRQRCSERRGTPTRREAPGNPRILPTAASLNLLGYEGWLACISTRPLYFDRVRRHSPRRPRRSRCSLSIAVRSPIAIPLGRSASSVAPAGIRPPTKEESDGVTPWLQTARSAIPSPLTSAQRRETSARARRERAGQVRRPSAGMYASIPGPIGSGTEYVATAMSDRIATA